MCGIVGFVTTEKLTDYQKRAKWLNKALFVDTLRGPHSTGLCLVPHDVEADDHVLYKKALPGHDFIELSRVEKFMGNLEKYKYVIGHNRWATSGGISAKSAHPFKHGNISMVHNGTLEYWTGLDTTFSVDSEAICHALSVTPANEVLETLDGAFALVWHDALDDTFHLARNKERELYFAFTKDKKTMFYASEPWMIKDIMPAGIHLEEVGKLKVGAHVTIDAQQDDLSKFKVEKFKPFEPPFSNYDYYSKGGKFARPKYTPPTRRTGTGTDMTTTDTTPTNRRFDGQVQLLLDMGYLLNEELEFKSTMMHPYANSRNCTLYGNTLPNGTVTVQDKVVAYSVPSLYFGSNRTLVGIAYGAKLEKGKYIILMKEIRFADEKQDAPKIVNSRGEEITEKQFNKLAKHGCAVCCQDISATDSEFIDWTTDGAPLCLDCSDDAEYQGEA